MSRKVLPQQTVKNLAKAAIKKRGAYSLNWRNKRIDGTFKKSKRNKYSANGRWVDERWFASKAEADRYEQLKEMQAKGWISELECQPRFRCTVNGQHICDYLADFRYRIKPGKLGSRVLIEDVKGMVTKEYAIKRRLVHALWPIEIVELKLPKRGNVSRYRWLTADQFHTAKEDEHDGAAPSL